MAVALSPRVGEKAWWRRQYLHLGGGVDVVKYEAAAQTAEPPRLRVVGDQRGPLCGLERLERQAVAGFADFRIEVARWSGAHAAVARGATTRRHVGASAVKGEN
jgi:hypothetical protein